MNRLLWPGIFTLVLIWSAISPRDYRIWALEVFPALIAAAILAFTRGRFPLTPLLYTLILIHCIILMVGGHYTYAEVPLFDWLREVFDWQRNNYDKVGHFAQGFIPAIVAREIIVRRQLVNGPHWRNFFIVCVCLAASAFYEFIEWWVAVLAGESADAFLATQGYVWDTQSDMFLAMVGAISALLVLGRWHDRQMRNMALATDQ